MSKQFVSGAASLVLGSAPQYRPPGIAGRGAKRLLDADQLVVFGVALAARQAAGLDLAAVGGDREVGDRGVLGLAGAVAYHSTVACAMGDLHHLQRFRQRA